MSIIIAMAFYTNSNLVSAQTVRTGKKCLSIWLNIGHGSSEKIAKLY